MQPVTSMRSNAYAHRRRRPAAKENHPRDGAGPRAAFGGRTQRADCAADVGGRAVAGGGDEEARFQGSRKQLLQVVAEEIGLGHWPIWQTKPKKIRSFTVD